MNKYEEITGLRYSGRAFELSFYVLGSNKKVSLNINQTYMFEDKKMYDYYRQFQGLSFIIDHNINKNGTSKKNNTSKENSIKEPIVEEIKLEPKKEIIESLPDDVMATNEGKERVKNIIAEAQGKKIDTISDNKGHTFNASSISEDEIKEILDMSFEEEQLIVMLKELGMSVDNTASKSFLINKLLEIDKDFVIDKINKRV